MLAETFLLNVLSRHDPRSNLLEVAISHLPVQRVNLLGCKPCLTDLKFIIMLAKPCSQTTTALAMLLYARDVRTEANAAEE